MSEIIDRRYLTAYTNPVIRKIALNSFGFSKTAGEEDIEGYKKSKQKSGYFDKDVSPFTSYIRSISALSRTIEELAAEDGIYTQLIVAKNAKKFNSFRLREK